MYYYMFSSNNSFEQIIVDDTGIPIQRGKIKYSETSDLKSSLEKSDKLLIFGEALEPDQLNNVISSNQMKAHVYHYTDVKVSEIFDEMETEEDWEDFFNQNDISHESAKSPLKYICH